MLHKRCNDIWGLKKSVPNRSPEPQVKMAFFDQNVLCRKINTFIDPLRI